MMYDPKWPKGTVVPLHRVKDAIADHLKKDTGVEWKQVADMQTPRFYIPNILMTELKVVPPSEEATAKFTFASFTGSTALVARLLTEYVGFSQSKAPSFRKAPPLFQRLPWTTWNGKESFG